MKVLWVGDAVVSTGFSRCTHAVCDALYAAGHEINILGINYHGDPHPHPYDIYPCYQPWDQGRDFFGAGRLPMLSQRLSPDVIVLLNDPWNIPGYVDHFQKVRKGFPKLHSPPMIGGLAVDSKNQRGNDLSGLAHAAVWTRFAADELCRGGYTGEVSVVPLGVDHDTFYPRNQQESRRMVLPDNIPDDAFIVGVVGRNQIRKRLDLTLAYFAEWIDRFSIKDAYLFMHVAPTGDHGVDLLSLIRYHKLGGRVILSNPNIGHGEPEFTLARIYSSFDCYLTTSQAEGWCLPVLEAMACGVPCIVPDWAALSKDGGWVGDAAIRIPCSNTAPNASLNANAYTLGGVPDRASTIWSLNLVYRDPKIRRMYSDRAVEHASKFSWEHTGSNMISVLESIANRPSLVSVGR